MTVAERTMTVEWLSVGNQRGERMRDALAPVLSASGDRLFTTTTYRGGADVLMLWGPGNPERAAIMREHIAAGGHCAVFDLAYWKRDVAMRVSIDAAHPQAVVMARELPGDRLRAAGVHIADTWDPEGHVLIAGLGEKARVQYGRDRVERWERHVAEAYQARGYRVYYRRKKSTGDGLYGVPPMEYGTIDDAVAGAALVATWHSNVAVDAIRLGVPVICQDGAAAAVCGNGLPTNPVPLPSTTRLRFLQNLAYFNWEARESGAMWRFISGLLR